LNIPIKIERYKREEFTFIWILLIVAFLLFLSGIIGFKLGFREIKNIQDEYKIKDVSVNMSEYNCPPNLTDYQCETFARTAIVNGFDVDDFLLSRWK